MKNKYLLTILATCISFLSVYAQEEILYKKVDTTQLYLTVYHSAIKESNKKSTAIVFFFCGGWNNGKVKQFVN